MGPTQINGLPAHVLLVHAVVVLVPITVLLLLATVAWRGTHRRLGIATPLVALVTLVFVPVTTSAGEWLQARVPGTPLVSRHAELGGSLLPWVVGLFVLAAAAWLVRWRSEGAPDRPSDSRFAAADAVLVRRPQTIRVALTVLAVVVSVGALVSVYRIGDSGAKAAWQGNFTQTATSPAGD
jgi:hypothetical protein